MMKESLAKNGLMLGAFAVVTTALIALTHDPKIDDPALQYAINTRCPARPPGRATGRGARARRGAPTPCDASTPRRHRIRALAAAPRRSDLRWLVCVPSVPSAYAPNAK